MSEERVYLKTNISIIVPVFNEEKTVGIVLSKLLDLDLNKEIIVIDNGSTDKTTKIIKQFSGINYYRIENNKGKGEAVRLGIKHAKNQYCVIQDADLEYNPKFIPILLKKATDTSAVAVYGSRFKKNNIIGTKPFLHGFGNKCISLFASILFKNKITDVETCYKLIKTDVLKKLKLTADKFDFDPQVTGRLLKKGFKIIEISIEFRPRTHLEGKKITLVDGFQAFYVLLKERFNDFV